MSELMKTSSGHKSSHRQLLITVSALALISSVYAASEAEAANQDSDSPTVWIELGGQLSRLDDGQEAFAPPIMAGRPSTFEPSQKFERLPLYSIDETGKVSFEPDGSNWVFSASIRYGHTDSNKDISQRTYPQPNVIHYTVPGSAPNEIIQPPDAGRFAETTTQNGEHHLIADFQAGKDVGLGMFGGRDGSSVFGFGVRFAQFSNTSNIALKSDPDWQRMYKYVTFLPNGISHEKFVIASPYHTHAASLRATRSFHGIGPSISWNASSPIAGNAKDGKLSFDWGLNAAVLFGRQRAKTHHQTMAQYRTGARYGGHKSRYITYQGPAKPDHARARTVIVPNVDGFAGLTFRIENFKMSAGYRADFFFGAMDGGIDTAKKKDVGFFGPFAAVGIGLGG